jgi:MotA/TolQ/ExbB proton channel family
MAQLSQAMTHAPAPGPANGPADAVQGDDNAGLQHLAWLAGKVRGAGGDRYRYLLAARFALINIGAFALLGAAWIHGFVGKVMAADSTRLVVVIACVFVAGFVMCAWKIFATSREINRARSFDPLERSRAAEYLAMIRGLDGGGRGMVASALRLKLLSRIAVVRQIANSLVVLGLIGTVIGFIIALSGVDPSVAGKPETIAPMVGKLIEGMSVALYTTLVGAALNLWLTANYQMLASGTANLVATLMEFGESHVRA